MKSLIGKLPKETSFYLAATIAGFALMGMINTGFYTYVLATYEQDRLDAIQLKYIAVAVAEKQLTRIPLDHAAAKAELAEIHPGFQEMLARQKDANSTEYAKGYEQGFLDAGLLAYPEGEIQHHAEYIGIAAALAALAAWMAYCCWTEQRRNKSNDGKPTGTAKPEPAADAPTAATTQTQTI